MFKEYAQGWGIFLGLFVTVVAASLLIWIVGYALAWWAAPWHGKLEARQEIQSGSSRIANYNHFFNLCASVQSNEARVDELTTVIDVTQSQSEKDRLQISLAGVRALRAEGINQYNVDARKDYTQGQFRDSDLPYQLSVTDYKKGDRKTSCGGD